MFAPASTNFVRLGLGGVSCEWGTYNLLHLLVFPKKPDREKIFGQILCVKLFCTSIIFNRRFTILVVGEPDTDQKPLLRLCVFKSFRSAEDFHIPKIAANPAFPSA